MLRRCLSRWQKKPRNSSKPFGPERAGIGDFLQDRDFRDEKTMTHTQLFPREQADVRQIHKNLEFGKRRTFAIPRDLGELPRTYLLRVLFVNQPILQEDLWELLKTNDDCPFDSARHLDFVIRVALHQNWVVREKNQSDRRWYLAVHSSRASTMSKMIAEEQDQARAAETDAADKQAGVDDAAKVAVDDALDFAIRDLQHQLTVNVSVLQEQDRELLKDLPYVTRTGALDFAWHMEGGSAALFARAASASTDEQSAAGSDGSRAPA